VRGEIAALSRRRVGDFSEDGWAARARGRGKIRRALVKCLVSQKSEGESFLGIAGDAELGRTDDFDVA